ncbi:ribosomal protein S18-alanine N-acetyltransferase [Corynebacterium aquatimens]|uniref:Ribosomal-protein-alanine N-acetyltransferase n=1 Tax=Corynebacterium aquatimens TaxID=1190508 RepID=A0A931GWS8_9CORY|nr:ribosomal protein S18-alanine N-acetyltransferase [Corynebacterium aquatimens]MBG6123061.1 ribosomal-protein-alanine N-acetyltransferase [Corynebacterium aquatimens]WJY66605.1 ribosomal-protein-alanine N-acetyltransferase [Corynebacterium aquatimens]
MLLRELKKADATAAAAIEAELFAGDSPWSRDVFLVEFASPHTFYAGAFTNDGAMMGYAGVAKLGPRDDPEFEVHTIAVAKQHQRKGIGRVLMEQLVYAADMYDAQMFLEVRTDNAAAIALYEDFGFTRIGTRKAYYQPSGADAYTMMRHSVSELRSLTQGEEK